VADNTKASFISPMLLVRTEKLPVLPICPAFETEPYGIGISARCHFPAITVAVSRQKTKCYLWDKTWKEFLLSPFAALRRDSHAALGVILNFH
jgi:hypothetical protein